MQGQPLYSNQIPAPTNGQWPQTGAIGQPPQAFLQMNGGADQQPVLPFLQPGFEAPCVAPNHDRHQGASQLQPCQPPFMPNSGHNLVQNSGYNPGQNFGYNPGHNPVPNPVHNPVQNLQQSPVQDPVQNPVKNLLQNHAQNPVQNPVHDLVQNPIQYPGHNLVQNPVHYPVQNPIYNLVQTPCYNPVPNPVYNLVQTPGYNLVQTLQHNPGHNHAQTPYINQQQPGSYLLPAHQPSNQSNATLSPQFAPSVGFASGPPPVSRCSELGSSNGSQPAAQGGLQPGPPTGPFNTMPCWPQNGPAGIQNVPTNPGPPQVGKGGTMLNANGAVTLHGYKGHQGPPSQMHSRSASSFQNRQPSPATNYDPTLSNPQPRLSGHHSHDPSLSQPEFRTNPYNTQQLDRREKTEGSENDYHSRVLSRNSSQTESRTNLSNSQQLERREKTERSENGLKRLAEPQGGDWKRQRSDGPRVPGWKAKQTEAVDVSDQFALEDVNKDAFKKAVEKETDAHRLKQRQKQIDFGKNTMGYERYLEQIPRFKRQRGDPQTPKVSQVCSKRSWDGQIKKWRRLLHKYDPPVDDEAEFAEEEYVPGYRGDTTGGKDEEGAAEQNSAEEEEETVTVEASVFEEDEDEFVGL